MMQKSQKKLSIRKLLIPIILLVFLFSIIKVGTTLASTDSFTISSVEISNKSPTVDVNNFYFEKCKIINDITFHQVGDSITYKIKVKNNDDINYTVKSVSDDNKNEYISYIYDSYNGTKLNSKEDTTFEITEKYTKEISDIKKRNQNFSVNITFTLVDENGNTIKPTIPINPKTGDNIGIYITTAVASFLMLILLCRKSTVSIESSKIKQIIKKHTGKHYEKYNSNKFKLFSLLLVGLLILPTLSKATTNYSSTLTFENNISLKDKLLIKYTIDDENYEEVVKYGKLFSNPKVDEKEDYDFVGWYTENGTKFDINEPIQTDITLVAKYKLKQYNVTFMANDKIIRKDKVEKYQKVSRDIPKVDGYNVLKWLYENNEYDFDTQVIKDIVLVGEVERVYPKIELNLNSSYYIGSNVKLNATYTSGTKENQIKYFYCELAEGSEEKQIDNINDIQKTGTYKIIAKITDALGAIETTSINVEITGPTLGVNYTDNKTERHYFNYDVGVSGYATGAQTPIIDYKLYITKGQVKHTYDESGKSISNQIVYGNTYSPVDNLLGLEVGFYKIKIVATDEKGYEFVGEEETQIAYGSFDFNKGFTNNVITKTNVESFHFVDGVSIDLNNSTNWCDISINNDGGVIEWWEETSPGSGKYNVYIGGQYSHYVQSSSQNLSNLFNAYSNCKTIDLSYLSTINAVSMSNMFFNDKALTTVKFGDKFDSSTVADFSNMFNQANSLTEIDASVFDVSSAHSLYAFFAYAKSIKRLDLSSWDVSNVVNLDSIFMHIESIEYLDVSTWDTSNVKMMGYMFYKAWGTGSNIYTVDMSNWTFKEGVQVHNMFDEASRIKTTINITNNISDYSQMFHSATTVNGSGITVNYTAETENLVNNMINTRSNTRVTKGNLIN